MGQLEEGSGKGRRERQPLSQEPDQVFLGIPVRDDLISSYFSGCTDTGAPLHLGDIPNCPLVRWKTQAAVDSES